MVDAEVVEDEPGVRPVQEQWLDVIAKTDDVDELKARWREAQEAGAFNEGLRAAFVQRSADLKEQQGAEA